MPSLRINPSVEIPSARALGLVVTLTIVTLAAGFNRSPLWDEDETRFATIAQAMLESGDWVVPRFNGELAVDKPVLMHWAMAASAKLLGLSEFAVRLPSAIATVAAAIALFWAGRRWFDEWVGVVAALAYVGCLLVGIESHAATPDAILVALVTWATVLAADGLMPRLPHPPGGTSLTTGMAVVVGALTGLAVLCKGPVGFVGPLAVVWIWASWLSFEEARRSVGPQPGILGQARSIALDGLTAAWTGLTRLRPIVITLTMLAVAAPWYVTVSIQTAGAWPEGFFLVHNIGRFAAPMEKHAGSFLYHPLALLAGFFPWSSFLPLACVVASWRAFTGRRSDQPSSDDKATLARAASLLILAWLAIWLLTFSAAATKLPNYVLPAYPAAAMIVASIGVDEARRRVASHPRWMMVGVLSLAVGGVATAAAVMTAASFGLAAGQPAAVVGIVPVAGALCMLVAGRRDRAMGLATLVLTGLVFTALAVGPAAGQLSRANTLPGLVQAARAEAIADGDEFDLVTLDLNVPGIVFYAGGRVKQCGRPERCLEWLATRPDARLLMRADRYEELAGRLPSGHAVIARTRPLFRSEDVLLVAMSEPSRNLSDVDATVETALDGTARSGTRRSATASDSTDEDGSVIR